MTTDDASPDAAQAARSPHDAAMRAADRVLVTRDDTSPDAAQAARSLRDSTMRAADRVLTTTDDARPDAAQAALPLHGAMRAFDRVIHLDRAKSADDTPTVRSLHDAAMRAADRFIPIGDREYSAEEMAVRRAHARDAYAMEREALALAERAGGGTRTCAILRRSAAWLAYHAGDFRAAEVLCLDAVLAAADADGRRPWRALYAEICARDANDARRAAATPLEPLPEIERGLYHHAKGGRYVVVGVVRHSETLEPMVSYHADDDPANAWVRPYAQFVDGGRFTRDSA